MERLRAALDRGIAFLPDFIAGLVVLAVGVLIAVALRRAVIALLPRTGFDRFLVRHKLIAPRSTEPRAGSRAVGSAVFWVVMLVALMQTANFWRLGFVATGLAAVIGFLPNVLAAALIFGGAFLAGNWIADRLRASPSEQRYGAMLPGAVRAGILTVGGFMALRQLLIAPEILVIAFACVFGAIAVAMALAFGLGGRRAVERMTEDWYDHQRGRRPMVPSPTEGPTLTRSPYEEPREPGGLH